MGFTENAFSVHNFINSVGADAGFASIIGLAILVLLYFAQARETASLREHAKEAATRIMELERRVAQLTQAGPAPAPSPAAPVASVRQAANPIAAPAAGSGSAAGVPAPISAAAVAALGVGEISASHHGQLAAMAPSAPAGVGAPPLNAATKLISTQSRVAAPVEHVPAAVPVATPPQAAPGTNGTGEHAAVLPQPAAAAVSAPVPKRPPVQIRPGASTAGRPGGGAARPGGPPRGPAPRTAEHGPWSRGLIAALVVLAVAAVVVVLVIFTSGSGGGTTTQASSPTPTSNAPATTHHSAGPKPFNNATVTVAVLNGTPVSGLAGRTAARLTAAGFKQGSVATAGDQTRKATIVAYMPGHSRAAAAVAKELKLGSASVQPVDASTQAIACQTTPCTATVVVTVGADLSSQ